MTAIVDLRSDTVTRPSAGMRRAMMEAELGDDVFGDDPHFARTRLLALENTIGGRAINRDYLARAPDLTKRKNLSTHLDGARVFNAATALKTNVRRLCAGFDSVSACLSKGLGAPAGTVLLGARGFVARPRRARKILGGAMRQAGILAAAGLYALENNVERLAEDHRNAERLASGLRGLDLPVEHHTNMVFVRIPAPKLDGLGEYLKARGILVLPGPRMRLATHLDVDAGAIDRAVAAFAGYFRD